MADPIDIHVGKRLRLARTLSGLSLEQVANRLDLTFQQLQKYEKGTNRVSAGRLWRLAQLLRQDPSWFFEEMEASIGVSAPQSSTVKPLIVDNTVARRETIELVRIMTSIDDKEVRASVLHMIDTLGRKKVANATD